MTQYCPQGEIAYAISQLRSGQSSAEALTKSALQSIERFDRMIGAFRAIDSEYALQRAVQLDEQLKQGNAIGPLHGIPIGLKDMFYTTRRIPSGGSSFLATLGPRPTHNASIVSRLEAAGAIIVGYLNMTEFAVGPTGHNAHYGPCHNPYNTDYIAGGSSSGSGAAVSARMVFASVGSDTGGSIRIPAAVNGVYGIKPTFGLIPRTGSMPLSYSLDTLGPLARHPSDLATLLKVMAGSDGIDASVHTRAVHLPSDITRRDLKGLRIGINDDFFNAQISDESKRTLSVALDYLVELGATVESVSIRYCEEHKALSRALFYAEAAAIHGHWLRERLSDYSDQVGNRLLTGMMVPAMTYLEAQLLRPKLLRTFVSEAFDRCDILITPAMATDVPTLQETNAGGGPLMWSVIDALLRNAAGFNYLGLPALIAPIRLTSKGLPSSVQLIARPFAESKTLSVAYLLEQMTKFSSLMPAQLMQGNAAPNIV